MPLSIGIVSSSQRRSGGPPSIAYQESEIDIVARTVYTFSNKSFGAPGDRSLVAVALTGQAIGLPDSVTIGGVTATHAVSGGSSSIARIFYAIVPSAASGDIVVTFALGEDRCGCHVFALYNLTSTTPTATASDTADGSDVSAAIDIQAGGVVLAAASKQNNTTTTWIGATERYDQQGEGTHTASDYTATVAETGRTITADFAVAGDETGLAIAAWA